MQSKRLKEPTVAAGKKKERKKTRGRYWDKAKNTQNTVLIKRSHGITEFTSTVLGKRKETRLVLHLQSDPQNSDSEYADEEKEKKSNKLIIVNGQLVLNTKKIYQCTYQGCKNTYTKPSRLQEHERSHTGNVSIPSCPFPPSVTDLHPA